MRRNIPPHDYFLGKAIPFRQDILLKEFIKSGNNGLVFRGYSEDTKDVACKIVPRANLASAADNPELWKKEIRDANTLKSTAVVKFWEVGEWVDKENSIDCVVMLSEYVSGYDLRTYLSQQGAEITVQFAEGYLATMLDLLNEMSQRGIHHGDLHSGNVMVEDRRSYSLAGDQYAFRVTDFGVTTASSGNLIEDDYQHIAITLKELLESIDYQQCNPRDRFAFNFLKDNFLATHLTETDGTRNPFARQPAKLFQLLESLDVEFQKRQDLDVRKLSTPFDYLSCEQIGDSHSMLQALYSNLFLGLADLENRNNIVLTGPRGCGKTTVFRSLSLQHRLHIGNAAPEEVRYVGIYYRCDDLYFTFPRYTSPPSIQAIDIPIHLLTATLLAQTLQTIEAWATKYFAADFRKEEPRLAAEIWNRLGVEKPREPGADSFQAIATRLQKERLRAAKKQRLVHDPKQTYGQYWGPDVLPKVAECLSQASFLAERPIFYFIDDYSSPKITEDLQQSLNRVLFQRSGACFYKMSTESPVSFANSDIDKKTYVEGREYALSNLGLKYMHADADQKLAFIDDVFRRRFAAVTDYPVPDLTTLLGQSPQMSQNETARRIAEGKPPEISGKESFAALCSGDIHYLIELAREMVARAGGTNALKGQNVPRIDPAIQNKVIREAAGNFLRNLRSLPKHGDQLVRIVSAFGSVAHSFLKYRKSKNEEGVTHHQAIRVEPYEALDLSGTAKELYNELLRYSVFIEDVRGKSRRGKVVPRLYLRKFLIPHFNLTFSTRDSLELNPADFEQFLRFPDQFENTKRLRGPEESAEGLPLFGKDK